LHVGLFPFCISSRALYISNVKNNEEEAISMRIPNLSEGIIQMPNSSRRFTGTIIASREPTRFDYNRSCEDCDCNYSESRRRVGGREIITVRCACPSEAAINCVFRKLEAIEAELVLTPPSSEPDTGPGITLPGFSGNLYLTERARAGEYFPFFPARTRPNRAAFAFRRFR
jgi:hypothetical protein